MKISKGWNVAIRLRQDPNTLYRGVLVGFVHNRTGKHVDEGDLMVKRPTVCLVNVEFHSDRPRGIHIGGSLDDGFDEVYPIAPPAREEAGDAASE